MQKKERKNNIQLIFFIVLVLFGIMIGLQIRSIGVSADKSISTEQLLNEYKEHLEKEIKEGAYLNQRIIELEKERDEYINIYSKENDDEETQKKLYRARLLAGLTDVRGEGIEIVLADATYVNSKDLLMGVSDYIIHDRDLSELINDLKKAGAEAISINDERVISSTSQICMGPTIRVNNKKLTPPFIIKAIGKAKKLENKMLESNLYYNYKFYGKKFEIEKKNDIRINRYIRVGDVNGKE